MKRALLILIPLLLPALAHADPNDELALGSWSRALHAPSANAVTDQPLGGGTFAYARRVLPRLVLPKLSLWGTAAFSGGATTGTMFQIMETSVGYLQFTAGAQARYALWPQLVAGARLELGTSRARLDIDAGGMRYSDHGWGAVTTSALALDLLPYARKAFAIGVRGELGRTKASGIELTPHAGRADDGTIELPVMRSSLGRLDLGGTFVAFTVIAQF